MGLDAVELVMDVEDHFGISIQDHEAQRVDTVGSLVELVQSRIDAAKSATCPILSSFLLLRSTAREVASDSQLRVRPSTRVVDVLAPSQRRELWRRLAELIGGSIPTMRRSEFARKLLQVCATVVFILAVNVAGWIDWAILPLTLLVAGVVIVAMLWSTTRLCVYPPEKWETLGAIAKRIAGTTVATRQLQLQSFDSILQELRPIVARNLGVEESEVRAEARFDRDLGMS
ncbi:acyl carrier protein [Aeoliella sp.]|uniref:acyl carrier protein n=1 Tax=Aeoliella sp. TaxID=2795800 RepID=UPI003CCC0DA7